MGTAGRDMFPTFCLTGESENYWPSLLHYNAGELFMMPLRGVSSTSSGPKVNETFHADLVCPINMTEWVAIFYFITTGGFVEDSETTRERLKEFLKTLRADKTNETKENYQ